ncbi:cytoplasmic tRNA 2-thiolation protein 2 [Aspergillus californicus]
MPGKELSNPCMDCQDADAILTIRRRSLCRECYIRFVGNKVFKRMEKYRYRKELPKNGPCTLLLPLSYGLSSSVLLHMVYAQVENLLKPHSPPGFDIHVLVIEPSSVSPSSPSHDVAFESLRQRYPLVSMTRLPLHGLFELVPDLQDILPKYTGQGFVDNVSQSPQERLDAFRASITSATSVADVNSILLNRLTIAFAKSIDCAGIIWGDSDDRLAAKTLASVAMGRGSSLTWQVSDGKTPFGLNFDFPLRDLFTAELQSYANLFPDLTDTILPDIPLSENLLTKNLSIDQLMMRYVSSQGAKYPGVMSNVTRTANKLQGSQMSTVGSRCALCDTLICSSDGMLNQLRTSIDSDFCYACDRSRPG